MPGYIGQGKVQFFDNNGNPLSGGQVWVYEAGTVATLVDTYDDYDNAIDQINPQANPVPLNNRGEAIIIITDPVKLVVEDSDISESTGHGTVIWTLDNFAVADALDASTGAYHFSSNSIVNGAGDIAFGFNAVASSNSYVVIDAKASDAAPVIRPVCAAVTDQDLILTPQNSGYITAKNKLKVDYISAGGNQLVLTGVNTGSHPTITTEGADAAPNIIINPKSTGILDVQANTAITGTLSASGAATLSAAATVGTTLGVTGAATFSSTIASGAITSTSTVQGTDVKLSNSGFTAAINAPTLAANRTWTWPNVDGNAGYTLKTNGSGVLSFAAGSKGYAIVNAYKSGSPGTQSIPASTFTKVTFDAETFDPDAVFDSATNYRYSPLTAGYYRLSFAGYLLSLGAADSWGVIVYKNGSAYFTNYLSQHGQGVGSTNSLTQTWTLSANGTDYFEIFVVQDSAGALTLYNANMNASFIGT